jgi:BolA protein
VSVEQTIRARLSALQPLFLEVLDESHRHAGHAGAKESGGGHFEIVVVSAKFEGQQPLARHRMVYDALAGLMPNPIHALSIRAYTPWEAAAGKH